MLAEVDVGKFWVPADDEVTRPYLQRRSAWEEGISQLLRRLLRPGARFLDVGAAVGYFSVLAAGAAWGITVDAVEPNPPTVDLLRFNLWANRVEANIWPVALSERRGALPLTSCPTNFGDTRGSSPRVGVPYSVVVPAVPADELFKGRTFDVVKIDVQGSELDVLLGMQRIIHESPSIAIVLEFWPTALRDRREDPEAVLDRYKKLNLEAITEREGTLGRIGHSEIIALCDSAGPDGAVNLLLRPRPD